MPLRALKKSYRSQPEAASIYFLIIASSGCLQERRQCLFFYWSKFVAGGVTWFSVSAEAASEGRPTAVIHAGSLENKKITVKHKDGTAKPIKVKKTTVKPKIVGGMVGVKKMKKNLDDATSTVLPAWVMRVLCRLWGRIFHVENSLHCLFCGCDGQIVDQFPRRGYG